MDIPFQPLFEAIAAQAQVMNLGVYVVGGFVRDLLRGQPNKDIDLVVEGDAITFAESLKARYGGEVRIASQFGTTNWLVDTPTALKIDPHAEGWPALIDIATARRETYAQPAALPTVYPGTIDQDLARRDFTINTLALRLTPPPFATLIDLHNGKQDLEQRIIRVLHDLSFFDDPTRIFRAVRFEQRLDFTIEPHTAALLTQAISGIDQLSGKRIRTEIEVIFNEREPEKALLRLDRLGVLRQISAPLGVQSTLTFDEWSANAFIAVRGLLSGQSAQHDWGQSWVDLEQVYWAILGARLDDPKVIAKRLDLSSVQRALLEAGQRIYLLLPMLEADLRPSEVARLLAAWEQSAHPLLAAWAFAPTERPRYYLATYATLWRHIKTTITGDDLLRKGLPQGKLFGTLLTRLREAKQDGLISTPDQEREYLERLITEASHDG